MLLIGFLLSSCSKNGNNLPITPASLAGTWILQTATDKTYTNNVLASTTIRNADGSSITFNALSYGSWQQQSQYIQSSQPFSFSISGNVIDYNYKISDIDYNSYATVKILTSTKLELFKTIDGTPTNYTSDIIYTKQ